VETFRPFDFRGASCWACVLSASRSLESTSCRSRHAVCLKKAALRSAPVSQIKRLSVELSPASLGTLEKQEIVQLPGRRDEDGHPVEWLRWRRSTRSAAWRQTDMKPQPGIPPYCHRTSYVSACHQRLSLCVPSIPVNTRGLKAMTRSDKPTHLLDDHLLRGRDLPFVIW